MYPGGQSLDKQAYAQLLAQQNETIPQFEAEIRDSLLASRLLELVDAGVIVPPRKSRPPIAAATNAFACNG